MRTIYNASMWTMLGLNVAVIGAWAVIVTKDAQARRTRRIAADMAAANEADDLELWAREMGHV